MLSPIILAQIMFGEFPLQNTSANMPIENVVHTIDWTFLGSFIGGMIGLILIIMQITGYVTGPKKIREEAFRDSKYFNEIIERINTSMESIKKNDGEDFEELTSNINELKTAIENADSDSLKEIHLLQIEVAKLKTTMENQEKMFSKYGEEQKALRENISKILDQIVEMMNCR